jgi:acyl carrier protein
MNQGEVIARLQSIFDNIFLEKVELTPELTAKDVEEWDSLIHISLVVAVESEFQISFRMGEVEATKSVGDFADLIRRRVNEKAEAR